MRINGTVSSRGLAQSHLSKAARACVGANIADGVTSIKPSMRHVAAMTGVSTTYLARARRLSVEYRQAIIEKRNGATLPAPVGQLPPPK